MSFLGSCVLALATVVVSSASVLAEMPSFTPLGDLPGGTFRSFAGGVSADGSIAAGWSDSGSSEAFSWQAGVMMDLGFPASTSSYPFSGIQAISADGSVLAGSGASDEGTNEPFRWENGVFTKLGRIPGYGNNAHFTTAMSDDGRRIVGWGYDSTGDRCQAWLWENGTMTGLGNFLPSSPQAPSSANGISGDGNVVVGGAAGPNGEEAFRWIDGAMTGLGFLPAPFPDPNGELCVDSLAASASYDGSVIVGSSTAFDYEGHYQREAFRWSAGAMIGLGDLPGGDFRSDAIDLSADGSVILGQGSTDEGQAVFIWDSVHGVRSLQELLQNDCGLDLTGWRLIYARGLSSDGSVVVGTGINPQGDYEAFRAVIPEPTGLSLFALVGMTLSRRRPR